MEKGNVLRLCSHVTSALAFSSMSKMERRQPSSFGRALTLSHAVRQWHPRFTLDSRPTNGCVQVCGLKQPGCHAGQKEVSRWCTRGESEEFVAHR